MFVGMAGNQAARAEGILRSLQLPVDLIGTSGSWGVEKPSTAFFGRVVQEAGTAADDIPYIGDRIDNDIRPAQEVGLQTTLIRRGPWGMVLRDEAVTSRCTFVLDDLKDLAFLVHQHNKQYGSHRAAGRLVPAQSAPHRIATSPEPTGTAPAARS